MRKFFTIAWLLVPLATACSDDDNSKPETIRTAELDNVASAVYDDATYSYAAELTDGSTTVFLRFAEQPGGVAMDNPVPQTGSYEAETSDAVYKVSTDSWWKDATGTHPVTGATLAVVASGNGCNVSGTLTGTGETSLRFRSNTINFSHSVAKSLTQTGAEADYRSEESDCSYKLSLKGTAGEVDMLLYAAASDISHMMIPDGTYRLVSGPQAGGISAEECGWSDADGSHQASEAVCRIVNEGGRYTISGTMSSASGKQVRYTYRGSVTFSDAVSPYPFTELGGTWNMTTDRWFVYDKSQKEWVYSDTGDNYSMSMAGIPKYRCMLSTGLFDATFSMLIGIDDQGLFIPCNVSSNPVAQVVSGSGTFWLFATLYDPETGYFLSGSRNVPLELSEDFAQFATVPVTGETTDPDTGEKITLNYNYFGLIGANISTGKYSMFSNWPFVRLPHFTRPGAQYRTASVPAAFSGLRQEQTSVPEKVTATIPEEEILKIIPITRNL